MADENDLGFINILAQKIGTSDNILRLVISLLAEYPLAVIYRQFVHGRPASSQHVFFTITGLALCYFNFGNSAIHSVINILLGYAMLQVFGGTTTSVLISFVLNVLYLGVGYYHTMSPDYAVRWTTPQCVLTLRMVGLAWDYYDGTRKPEDLSAEQKETALRKLPSLLEILGYNYFFGGFLVGPQFSMRRYQDFVHGVFSGKEKGQVPASVTPGLIRLAMGVLYTTIYQISAVFIPDSYLVSQAFESHVFPVKCLLFLLWGKLTIYRYIGVWLITEGACIMTGLTYNGRDENGNDLWDACANVHIQQYECSSKLHELIQSFNVNTNKWMGKYVFKRLKFLGNKFISQGVTLFFLALWHGLYSGYFMNFFLEFFMMKFETEAGGLLAQSSIVRSIQSLPGGNMVLWVTRKAYVLFCLSYALASFCLLVYTDYLQVYWSLYFVGHLWFLVIWPLAFPYLRRAMRPRTASHDTTNRMKKE